MTTIMGGNEMAIDTEQQQECKLAVLTMIKVESA